MLVKLTYFKPNGKYYSEGEYETKVEPTDLVHPKGTRGPALFLIWEEVAQLKERQLLPDLRAGHSDFTVLIDVPDHPHRHLHLLLGPEPTAQDASAGPERCPRCWFTPCRRMFQCSESDPAVPVGYISNARIAEIARCAEANASDHVLTTIINSRDLQLIVAELQRRRGGETPGGDPQWRETWEANKP